jgi:hypothetical protein
MKTSSTPSPNRYLLFLGLVFTLAFTFSTTASADRKAEAEALTHSLVGLNNAYQRARSDAKSAALQQLIDATVERQALLAELIESDPGAVLRVAMPERVRRQMPAEVQQFIEQRLDLQGELEVMYHDFADGSHRLFHTLSANGKRIALSFESSPTTGLLSGTPAQVSGVLLDDSMAVESGDKVLKLASGGGVDGGSNGGTPAPLPNTLGEQSTLVILVNFQDAPTDQPWTLAEVDTAFFGEVNDFFLENSFGHSSLVGDVFGWFTIPSNSSACDMMEIEAAARSAAVAAGANLEAYMHHVYVFPQTSGCSFLGTSTVGGNPSRAWINGDLLLENLGHELGHSMGLYHAHSIACEGSTLGDNCTTVEYGDGVDIMGWSPAAHFTAFNKERLGWLNNSVLPPITIVQGSGTFDLEPYASNGSGAKALKVYKGPDPATGLGVWYYIEYRQPVGFDSVLGSLTKSGMYSSNLFNGVVIHTGIAERNGNTSYLLDMTPETFHLYARDPALTVDRSYSDPEAGITITPLSAETSGAVVEITFGAQICVPTNPGITITPPEPNWDEPGAELAYTVQVSNNDSSACASTQFDLSANIPAGWMASFTDETLTLAPGTSGSTTLAVVSASNEADGNYDIEVTAAGSDPNQVSVATATYVVSASAGNEPPVAVDDSEVITEVVTVTIDVLQNDFDPDGDSLQIASVTQGSRGSVTIDAAGMVTYTPARRFKDRDSFSYTVSDNMATATATVNIVLESTSGGGKGGGKGKGKT